MSGAREVESFLQEIGLESCVQAVVHNGFYTSMEALRGANYEELVDSGVRPVHAKLIISNLGSKDGFSGISLSQAPVGDGLGDEVGQFLRSIGLENCGPELAAAGYASVELLGEASMQDLLNGGLKPVHARLIVSNLDSASTAGLTPVAQRLASIDAGESGGLLGAPKKARPRRGRLLLWAGGCLFIIIAFAFMAGGSFGGAPAPALPPAVDKKGHEPGAAAKHKGKASGGGGEGTAHPGGKHKPL